MASDAAAPTAGPSSRSHGAIRDFPTREIGVRFDPISRPAIGRIFFPPRASSGAVTAFRSAVSARPDQRHPGDVKNPWKQLPDKAARRLIGTAGQASVPISLAMGAYQVPCPHRLNNRASEDWLSPAAVTPGATLFEASRRAVGSETKGLRCGKARAELARQLQVALRRLFGQGALRLCFLFGSTAREITKIGFHQSPGNIR